MPGEEGEEAAGDECRTHGEEGGAARRNACEACAELAILEPDHGNNLVLAGAYQRQNGVPSYQFALTRRCDFLPGGSFYEEAQKDVWPAVVGVRPR